MGTTYISKLSISTSNLYSNSLVQKIRHQIGEFDYSKQTDTPDTNLEFRSEQLVDNESRAKYEGQWVTGTTIRMGMGQAIYPDGTFYEGWWRDNKANG